MPRPVPAGHESATAVARIADPERKKSIGWRNLQAKSPGGCNLQVGGPQVAAAAAIIRRGMIPKSTGPCMRDQGGAKPGAGVRKRLGPQLPPYRSPPSLHGAVVQSQGPLRPSKRLLPRLASRPRSFQCTLGMPAGLAVGPVVKLTPSDSALTLQRLPVLMPAMRRNPRKLRPSAVQQVLKMFPCSWRRPNRNGASGCSLAT